MKRPKLTVANPLASLLDQALIGSAIMQCLIENDPDGVMEVIESHLYALNKSKSQDQLSTSKRKNPTIKTLAKILHTAHR